MASQPTIEAPTKLSVHWTGSINFDDDCL